MDPLGFCPLGVVTLEPEGKSMFVLIPAAEQKERLAAQGAVCTRGRGWERGSRGSAPQLSSPLPPSGIPRRIFLSFVRYIKITCA